MNDALTARQTQILKLLVDEYINTAFPVGSASLEKKYNLGVSPATIRNEMVELTNLGFIKQPFTSAGRVPTPKGMKFYVNQLMEEKDMSLTDEVKAKEEVWDARGDVDTLFREATHSLAQRTQGLALGTISGDSRVWHSGYANIFSNPEFADASVCESLFGLIDKVEKINEVFFGREFSSPVEVFFGEDVNYKNLEPVGFVAARFAVKGRSAALAVAGPMRISNPTVIPVVRYFGSLLEEMLG
jgi:heat-inducible transcriptional repressor